MASKKKAGFDRVAYMQEYNRKRWLRIKKERAAASRKRRRAS